MGLADSGSGKRTKSPAKDSGESRRLHGEAFTATTRRDREKLRCREEILAVASRLFALHGFEKTSVKQIADEADVSVGGLYTHFTGKEEIFRELLGSYVRELHRRGDEACRAADEPLEQLRCRINAAIEHFKEHVDFLMIYHNENPLGLAGLIREEIEKNTETAAKLLARAIKDGDIPPEDPHVLAAMLIGSVHELMHMFAERGNKESFDEIPGIIDRILMKPLEMRQQKDSGMEGR